MDTRFEIDRPVASHADFGPLEAFIEAYIRNFYDFSGSDESLSARDVRYAAMSIGYQLEHDEALALVERMNIVVQADLHRARLARQHAVSEFPDDDDSFDYTNA